MKAPLEFPAMARLATIAALAALGCGGPAFEHALPSSPLVAAGWDPRFRDAPGGGGAKEDGGDVRERMVAEARALLADGTERPEHGYGARDLDEILGKASPAVSWDARSGLAGFVALAREKGAFRESADPEPGDVALFHDQIDADADGELDDPFTGCGVVTEARRGRFSAVTRTGRAPREIVVSPGGPAVATLDGERVNSYLRVPSRSDPAGAEYLAGRLFAGYVDIEALDAAARGR